MSAVIDGPSGSATQPTAPAVPTAPTQPVVVARTLDYFPIGLFGSVMSLTGLSVAWRLAQGVFGSPQWVSMLLQLLSTGVFVVLLICYLIKCVTAPQAVRTEFNHPIIGNLFGTLIISLLLQPIVIVQWSPPLARGIWIIGAVAMTLFAWLMMTRWISSRQQIAHATPAWIVPVVGMLDIPLALPVLGLPPMPGVMIMSLAVGLFFGVPIFTMVMMRLIFEEPLPNPLAPTLLVLMAPFSVGVSTYFITTGTIDLFAESLYAIDVFLLAVLFGRLRYLRGCCPFRVSWWAVGFPLAATAIAGLRITAAHPTMMNAFVAALLLGLATALVLALIVRTMIGVFDGELRHLSS